MAHDKATIEAHALECPICCELLQIPIFQCDNGHLACSPFCGKVQKKCPSCKLLIGYNRCRAMENVVEASRVPCPNAKYGCKENISYGNRSSHEKQCFFPPCYCPVFDCNYTGSSKDLKNHISAKHKGDLILFKWETPLIVNSSLCEKLTILKEARDGELIVVQNFNRPSHGLFVSVSCIAAPLAAETCGLVCTLKLSTLHSAMKQVLVVKKVQKMSDGEPWDGFMLIPYYMLQGQLNTMKICIARGNARV